VLGAAEHDAAEQIVVAAEVLRRAVDHVVGAVGERAVVHGRGERRVDHDLDAARVADTRRLATSITRRYGLVGDSVKKSRVSGRIASASCFVSLGLDHGRLDVELGEVLLDELARAPVAVARHDQVPPLGSSARKSVVAAHMPDAASTAASAPSRSHSLRSTARQVGLP
jgi:hypothetical protein